METPPHNKRPRILHLEDNRYDAELINIRLRSAGYECQISLVETASAFREALAHGPYDLIISDNALPSFDGLEALRLSREKFPDIPFIFVSGTLGEDSAIESLVHGATDYVLKGNLARLVPAVDRALRESKGKRDRLLAEEQARKAEGLYRLITENAEDLITVLDLEGKRVYNSPSYGKLLGDIGASRGTDSFLEVHPDDRERIKETFRRTIRTGVGERSEYRFVLADGSIRHIESLGNVVLDDAGKPVNVVVVSRDITELKRNAAETIRARDFYLSLFEDFPALIWRSDKDGKCNYVNRTWLAFTGRTREQELADGWIQGVHPDDLGHVTQTVSDAMAKRRSFQHEFRLMHTTGEYHWILNVGRPFNDLDGTFNGYIGTCMDVTDRKVAEDQLNFLSQAVQQSPTSIVLTDRDGAIQYANPRFTAITGYSLKEVLGHTPGVLKPGDTPSEEYRRMWQTISSGGEWHGELQNTRKDGTIYWESASISPVTTGGEITHYLAVAIEITDRKVMEDQVRQMQKMDSIGTLAGGIAHDFNNILAIIQGHISLVQIRKRDPEALGASINTMNKAVQRGAGLVRQILTFARKSDIVLEQVSLNDSIRELAGMFKETFPKTIELELSLDKAIPVATIDRTQFHQAILNLCVNARDAMMETGNQKRSPGGTLRIATSLVEGGVLRSKHTKAQAATYVCVSVSDTGVGMDEQTIRRIFEPFFTTKEAGKGTGLGLAVVYGVVHAHQGLIEVDSTRGKGTTIRLYLPVAEGIAAPMGEEEKPDAVIRGGNETILLVEDEVEIGGLMESFLADVGYRVLRAMDGKEALEVYSAHQEEIGVVLSDLGLPKLDGVALFARLKEINPDVSVIIASGYVDPDARAELTWAGASAIIAKPYMPREVLRIVRDILDKKKKDKKGR